MNRFNPAERSALLALKGVGETVISRLEQIGFSTLAQLADAQADTITQQIAKMMGSTCWQNSPQAKQAIQAIIDLAKTATTPSN